MDLRLEFSSSFGLAIVAEPDSSTVGGCATVTFPVSMSSLKGLTGPVAVSFPVSMLVSGGMPTSGVVSSFLMSSLSIESLFSSFVYSVSILVSDNFSPSFWISSSIG